MHMQQLFLIILSLCVLSVNCAGGPRRAQWVSFIEASFLMGLGYV